MSRVSDAPAHHAPPLESEPGLAGDAPETDAHDVVCDAPPESEARNFVCITLHQVLMRVGWVFKTESVVMPYFMEVVGGGPMLRGCLMVFNRFGFSVPPALFARSLKLMPQKRWAVAAATFGMAIPFAVLSIVWASGVWRGDDGEAAGWMPYFFLAAYGVFFTLTGVNQLAAHSIGGKLIRPERRGRLFAAGVVLGAPLAIFAAWTLMPRWLASDDGGFTLLFAAPAACFALASLTMLGVKENDDSFQEASAPAWRRLREAASLALAPGPCRTIAIVALLFSTAFMLFPHYVSVVTGAPGGSGPSGDSGAAGGAAAFDLRSLMFWTITQHTAVAALSLVAGPIADRFGTRLAVQLLVFGTTLGPLTPIALSLLPPETLAEWYWVVFLPLGFTPVTIKMLINYTLELVPRDEHPRYVSAIGMCLALPVIVGSPLVGLLVERIGPLPVFTIGVVVLLTAGAQTLRLREPRLSNANGL